MNLFDAFTKLINEHGTSDILRERLALLRDQTQALEKENIDLKKRVTELEDLSRKLAAELEAKARREEFVEHRGALFKRRPEGGYHKAVYCPECHNPMMSLEGFLPYSCERCKIGVDFKGEDLSKILAELPR